MHPEHAEYVVIVRRRGAAQFAQDLLMRGARIQQPPGAAKIHDAEEHPAVRAPAVAARASGLLPERLDGSRQAVMHGAPQIRAVHAQAESLGRGQKRNGRKGKAQGRPAPLRAPDLGFDPSGRPAVIDVRGQARGPQVRGDGTHAVRAFRVRAEDRAPPLVHQKRAQQQMFFPLFAAPHMQAQFLARGPRPAHAQP